MLSKTSLSTRAPRLKAVFYKLAEMVGHNNTQNEKWRLNSLSAYSHDNAVKNFQLVVANSYPFCTMGEDMTNRKTLEAYFAKQRLARKKARQRIPQNYHATPRRKRIGYVAVILVMLFTTYLTIWSLSEVDRQPLQQVSLATTMGGSSDFIVTVVTATGGATSKEFPLNSVRETSIPTAFYVCTNVANGLLHVRFKPGEGSGVRGYLAEGESIWPVLGTNGKVEIQEYQGGQWLRLSSPIKGWVNINFICE